MIITQQRKRGGRKGDGWLMPTPLQKEDSPHSQPFFFFFVPFLTIVHPSHSTPSTHHLLCSLSSILHPNQPTLLHVSSSSGNNWTPSLQAQLCFVLHTRKNTKGLQGWHVHVLIFLCSTPLIHLLSQCSQWPLSAFHLLLSLSFSLSFSFSLLSLSRTLSPTTTLR